MFLGRDLLSHCVIITTYVGQVPNCERCHDCYFQWFDIINNLTVRADSLQSTITRLITTYYNGHTEESLMAELVMLMEQLDQVNQTLSNITLEGSDVDVLEEILTRVCLCC